MIQPITIDLSGLKSQFGITQSQVDALTEVCVRAVTTVVYDTWAGLAKQRFHATLPDYLNNLQRVDKGRFEGLVMLTGALPNMLEQGAAPWDIKEGFRKSPYVRYTLPRYNAKGGVVRAGGEWYLTIPLRMGTPGTVGQAGFSNTMPTEVYNALRAKGTGATLTVSEIPAPYNRPGQRDVIPSATGVGAGTYHPTYVHKTSIYAGLTQFRAQYAKTTQSTYGTFRRAGAASDPDSWWHRGFKPANLAQQAVDNTDVETIVTNEVTDFLDKVLP